MKDYQIIIPPEDFEDTLNKNSIIEFFQNLQFCELKEIVIVPNGYLYPVRLIIDHKSKQIFIAKEVN